MGTEEKGRKARAPSWIAPMLATLTHEPFSDDDWIYERKLDGERVLAFRSGGMPKLYSRNRKRLDDTYPEIVTALAEAGPKRFAVDGEIVAFSGSTTSFARLQQRMQVRNRREAEASSVAVYYYVFDLLHLGEERLTDLPLRERKAMLRETFAFDNRLRYVAHRNGDGVKWLKQACSKGWEGLIAKRAESRYRSTRSRDWLKFKCSAGQELVIGGFTDPKGERSDFGALLVGHYEDGDLRYAGKVGTGFDDETLEELGRRLRALERETSPFADEVGQKRAHWVTPKLVAEIGFTEWTKAGRLRHPRFKGLRRDKPAKSVRREDRS